MNQIKNKVKHVGKSLLHWTWTKGFLFWIIISAGTLSELAFLLASMWKSIDASDHSFVLLFMTQKMSENIGYLATSAYILLPVCILPLGVVTTYTHLRTWIYGRKWVQGSGIWFVLYGLPTLTFLIIDICIISNSNGDHYVLPDFLTSIRSDMAYAYGLTAILYHYIGKQQEVDRLKEKDDFISQLVEENRLKVVQIEEQKAEMQKQIGLQKQEAEEAKQRLEQTKLEKERVQNALQNDRESTLGAYSQDLMEWVKNGSKTILVSELLAVTGIPKRRINKAIAEGKLACHSRNKDLILVSSLVTWLKEQPMPSSKTDAFSEETDQRGTDSEPIHLSDYTEISS